MARAQGARTQMAFAFETVYGTPPGSGFRRTPFASTTLGAEQPLLENELLGYGRDPLAPVKDAITVDGDMVVPICARNWGLWLKAALGNPITTGDDPYTHEFRSGAWEIPSFSLEKQMPDIPQFSLYTGCKVDRLSWTMQRSGQLTATVAIIAQGETNAAATGVGALATELTLQRMGHFNGVFKRNGVVLGNVVSSEITYANNLDRIETIRNDGRIDGVDPSMAMLSGSTAVRFADTTLFDQATAGVPCEFESEYELPGGEKMTLTAHAVYLPRPRAAITGPQGIQVTFDWQAARDNVVGRMCTFTLTNDVETY